MKPFFSALTKMNWHEKRARNLTLGHHMWRGGKEFTEQTRTESETPLKYGMITNTRKAYLLWEIHGLYSLLYIFA